MNNSSHQQVVSLNQCNAKQLVWLFSSLEYLSKQILLKEEKSSCISVKWAPSIDSESFGPRVFSCVLGQLAWITHFLNWKWRTHYLKGCEGKIRAGNKISVNNIHSKQGSEMSKHLFFMVCALYFIKFCIVCFLVLTVCRWTTKRTMI